MIQTAIANSQTLEEVARLEKVLVPYTHPTRISFFLLFFSTYISAIFDSVSLDYTRSSFACIEINSFLQALKQGQLPSDFVLPGDDASRNPTTEIAANVPPSAQHSEETTAMEEVMFSLPCPGPWF